MFLWVTASKLKKCNQNQTDWKYVKDLITNMNILRPLKEVEL